MSRSTPASSRRGGITGVRPPMRSSPPPPHSSLALHASALAIAPAAVAAYGAPTLQQLASESAASVPSSSAGRSASTRHRTAGAATAHASTASASSASVRPGLRASPPPSARAAVPCASASSGADALPASSHSHLRSFASSAAPPSSSRVRSAAPAAYSSATNPATAALTATEANKRQTAHAASASSSSSSHRSSGAAAAAAPKSAPSAAVLASALQAQWMGTHSLKSSASGSSPASALAGARRRAVHASTLAQHLGLVPAPQAKLTSEEWSAVRARARDRGEVAATELCPICAEEFRGGNQVLLSCSHVFHQVCLKNFEMFSGTRVCPLCRSKEYEKKLINDAAVEYRTACAVKIQSRFRCWRIRKQYLLTLSLIPPKDLVKRQSFFLSKLVVTSSRMAALMASRESAIDALFAEMDRNVSQVRQSLQAAEVQLKKFSVEEWESIRRRAKGRDEHECCICTQPIEPLGHPQDSSSAASAVASSSSSWFSRSKKLAVLLSCSHVLHHGCLLSFERFTIASSAIDGAEKASWATQQTAIEAQGAEQAEGEAPQLCQPPPACLCPLCRSNYQKTWL